MELLTNANSSVLGASCWKNGGKWCEGFFARTVKMKKRDKEREDTNAV